MSNQMKMRSRRRMAGSAAVVLGTLAAGSTAMAATDLNWTGAVDGAFGNTGNWSSPALPDGTATFNSAGNGKTLITVGADRNLGVLSFTTASAAGYTIGSALNEGSFTLSGATSINMASTVVNSQTVNSKIVIGVAATTFQNATTAASNLSLNIGGSITGGLSIVNPQTVAQANPEVLTLAGPGGGTLGGTISNGQATNLSLSITGGTWNLNASNSTFVGGTYTPANDALTGYNAGVVLSGTSTLVIGENSSATTGGSLGKGTLGLGGTWTVQAGSADRTISNNVVISNASGTFSGSNSLNLNGLFVFSGTATITNSISSGKQLTIGGDVHIRDVNPAARTVTFAGNGLTEIDGIVSNGLTGTSGALTVGVAGNTGTLKLTKADTYTGATSVTAGSTLVVNGSHAGTTVGSYSVNGILGGTGSISPSTTNTVTINSGGTLAAGDSTLATLAQTGTLDIASALTLASGSNFNVQLGGLTPGDGQGFYDQVNMTNSAKTIAALTGVNFNLSIVNGLTQPTAGSVFYVLTRADAAAFATTFTGLAEGAIISLGTGSSAQITYKANWTGTQAGSSISGGNDVAIYNVLIPEPTALAAIGLAGIGLLKRRRRRV